MYSLRDDTNIDVNRHRDLLHQSGQYSDNRTPLKSMITKTYQEILVRIGKQMVTWGYKLQNKTEIVVETPLLTPPYSS